MQDQDRNPDGENAVFTQILCAISDFDVFIQLMRETKEKEDAEAKAASSDEEPAKSKPGK
jgi:hypothetical protein